MRTLASVFSRAALALVVLGGILVSFSSAYGQVDSYIELLRSDIRTEKQALLTEAMQFSDEQAAVFWPIYREYDLELSKIGDQRVALIKDFAANFATMTDDKAKDMAKRSFKLEEDRVKLRKKYHGRVEKALDPIIAAKFVQIERAIAALIDVQLASELPLMEHGSGM
ncbi:MAG: hypothetical protein PVJ43_02005 [Gemmatimonadales bacterium]